MIRVLVVDDSAVVRQVLSKELSRDPSICVVGTALDPYVARDKIMRLSPDVLTLDIGMPRMDGMTFLEKLMKYHPMPVVVVSSLTKEGSELAMRALELGAVEVVPKGDGVSNRRDIFKHLREKVKAAARADVSKAIQSRSMYAEGRRFADPLPGTSEKILAIGASTGGTEALRHLLSRFPANGPATLVVQHMPERFTAYFAQRLDGLCEMEVREARNGDAVRPGRVLLAPGDRHMVLHEGGSGYSVNVKDGPMVNHQRPSIDVLFSSVARCAEGRSIGVLLTGMGSDGAKGLKLMREAGAITIAQDEKTSVVYGMPKAAVELGAAKHVLGLHDIAPKIIALLGKQEYQY